MQARESRHLILVPIDFSKHSTAALRRAIHLARLLDHDVALLHVVDTSSIVPRGRGAQATVELGHFTTRIREDAKAHLATLAAEADPEKRTIKIQDVIEGRPWQVILSVAASIQPQIIVMGKRGEGPEQVGTGSVAERVVRGASCDVLVVRESAAELKAVGQEE